MSEAINNVNDRVVGFMEMAKSVRLKKDDEYGSCWYTNGLGPRSTFVELSAKYHRLKKCLWDTDDDSVDNLISMHDTMIDMVNYLGFTIVLMEKLLKSDESKKKYLEGISKRAGVAIPNIVKECMEIYNDMQPM